MIDKQKLKKTTTALIESTREYLSTLADHLVAIQSRPVETFKELPDRVMNNRFIIDLYATEHSLDMTEINENLALLHTSEARQFYSIFSYLYFFSLGASTDPRYEHAFKPLMTNISAACTFIAAYGALALMKYYDKLDTFNDETLYLFTNAWAGQARELSLVPDAQEGFNGLLVITSSVVWSVMIRLSEGERLH